MKDVWLHEDNHISPRTYTYFRKLGIGKLTSGWKIELVGITEKAEVYGSRKTWSDLHFWWQRPANIIYRVFENVQFNNKYYLCKQNPINLNIDTKNLYNWSFYVGNIKKINRNFKTKNFISLSDFVYRKNCAKKKLI